MKVSIRLSLCFLLLVISSSCKKKSSSASTTSGTNWYSTFSTTTTPITNTYATSNYIFSGKGTDGTLFLSGTTGDGWTVESSTDNGVTWSAEAQWGSNTYGFQLATDSSGNVFNVGFSYSSNRGVVQKRDATTHVWSTVYSGQVHPGYWTRLYGVAVDSSDHIFAVGSTFLHLPSEDVWPDTGLAELVTLKSTDGGATWNPVDVYHTADHGVTQARGVFIASSGDIYVYGDTMSDHTTFIRKSSDGGATWHTVFEDINCAIRTMKEWNGGFIINEEYYPNGASVGHPRVRGTTDDFATLKTLDEITYTGATDSYTGLMTVDSRNYVYYSAYYNDSTTQHLLLRVNRGDGNWTTIDDYTRDTGLGAADLFVVGTKIFNTCDQGDWVLRTATLTKTDTFTPASMDGGTDFVSPVPSGAKRIYTTWEYYDGKLGTTPANAIAAADAICDSDSRKPVWDPTTTYKAMLVNTARRACTTSNCSGGNSEHIDWVFSPTTLYVTYEGKTIGTTDANGLFQSTSRGFINNTVSFGWNGLVQGAVDWTSDANCQDWTSNDSTGVDVGTAWDLRGSNLGEMWAGGYFNCDALKTITCVEQ